MYKGGVISINQNTLKVSCEANYDMPCHGVLLQATYFKREGVIGGMAALCRQWDSVVVGGG